MRCRSTWCARHRARVAANPVDTPSESLRSPARPNPIAISVVRLIGVEGTKLKVVGLDCLDDTPLVDLKPYFASTDSAPEAVVGWHTEKKR